ncbi:hypothetical protein RUM43_000486 [Polyplax serrata]|uniref:DUF4758 domain-containing protein n=1 Tax=Polyplax serrata TaxID=468196 RepID=A0AAN8SDE7_POLSC
MVSNDLSGYTTVLFIDNIDDETGNGRSARPSGVITSTARTFVHGGTTTEYGTQVIGTTLDHGKYYAQIVQTSSRIYFGSQEKSATKSTTDDRAYYKSRYIGLPQNVDNYIHSSFFLNFQPSEPVFIYPTRSVSGGLRSENREYSTGGRANIRLLKDEGQVVERKHFEQGTTSNRDGKEIFITQSSSNGGQQQQQPQQFQILSKGNGERALLENLIRLEKVDPLSKRLIDEIRATKSFSNQLPTVTIRHDFAPSGFSVSSEEEREEKVIKTEKSKFRSGKSLVNKPVEKKYDTVTYLGFADFVTTVGSTVIVFMPSTRTGGQSVAKETFTIQQSSSQKVDADVKTTIKTFLSHGPGMVTKTIPGHSLSMQTSLPTLVADRQSKALGQEVELKTLVLSDDQFVLESPSFSTQFVEHTEGLIEPSETMTYTVGSKSTQAPTEPLATFATTVTRTFNTGGSDKPLGLLKSIGGTKAYNGTTTHFTSLVYGTYVDGSYAQILKTSSSVFYLIESPGSISATVVLDSLSTDSVEVKTDEPQVTDTTTDVTDTTSLTNEADDELLETSDHDYNDDDKSITSEGVTGAAVINEVDKARKIKYNAKEQSLGGGKSEESYEKGEVFQTTTDELITRYVPSTVYKTFTYLTTFFIPSDDTTTTSIRSREVVTSDINLITKIIDPNLVSKEVFATSSILIPTKSNDVDADVDDEEFRLPPVRLLAPEEDVVIEETEDEERPETTTSVDEETTTEESAGETTTTEESNFTTDGPEDSEDSDSTPLDTTTETVPETSTVPLTTEETLTTVRDDEDSEEEVKSKDTEVSKAVDEDNVEVEVIYKTLFTTYTYLTTFFHESTTSISSSEVVVTNIVTSTLNIPSFHATTVKKLPQSTAVLQGAVEATKLAGSVEGDEKGEKEEDEESWTPTTVIHSGSETKFFDDEDEDEDESSVTLSPSKEISEDEVTATPALKTLYTTYTYYTTLFDEGSTEVKSRIEVVTNVVGPNSVSVLPSSILQNEELFKSKFEMLLREQQALRASTQGSGSPSSSNAQGSYSQSSASGKASTIRSSVLYSTINPSSSVHRFSQASIQPTSTFPSKLKSDSARLNSSRGSLQNGIQNSSIRPSASVRAKYGTFTRKYKGLNPGETIREVGPSENDEDNSVTRLIIKGDKKDRTVIRKRIRTKARLVPRPTDVDQSVGVTTLHLDPSPAQDDTVLLQTMVTDVKSSSSSGGRRQIRIAPPEPIERIGEYYYDDQISSESNTDEIEPSPTLVLQTSYTTFTYFTTVYKGTSSSDVISRLETVTNIVTETVKPEFLSTQDISPEDATLPITYFTTFTYWTTLYKDGNTIITSREETVSNVVTPSIQPSSTSLVEKTETQVLGTVVTSIPSETVRPSIFVPGFIPAATPEPVTEPAEVETPEPPVSSNPLDGVTGVLINKDGLGGKLEPTTYYTTYTYFTTSYVGDKTELKSRLETVTNVVTPTPSISEIVENDLQTGRAINSASVNVISKSVEGKDNVDNPFQTGLLSTVVSTSVEDGKTTLYSTDIFGTFIDGLYAKVLESTTRVVSAEEIAPTTSSEIQKTGVVSVNEGRIVDADGISTTFFTTKAIGTSIEQLYAQVVESTTSVLVDNDKKSALAGLNENQDENSLKTGLIQLTEGSIIQDGTTTLYESRLIGKFVDGNYIQVVESTSSYKIEPSVAPSVTIKSDVTQTSVFDLTSTSPSTLEGSIVDDVKLSEEEGEHEGDEEGEEEEEEDGDDEKDKGRVKSRLTFQAKKRTFTPVIRPFASRNRPTFLPKKKPLGTTGAQTITRANFTPTITATLATKTEGFTSRNRFGTGRKSSALSFSSEVKPTVSSSSRKFGRTRSSFSSPTISSSFTPGRGRSSSVRVSVTPTLNLNSARTRGNFRASSSRAFNFDNTVIRPSLPGSRSRIRPTVSGLPNRGLSSQTASTNPPNDKNNDLTTVVTEEDEGSFTVEEDGTPVTTTVAPTTEDPNLARRNNNPLLRFRRPLLPRASTTTTTPKPPTTPAPRRGILSGRNNKLTTAPNVTPRTSSRPQVNIGRTNLPGRSRPQNNLFPPRGLFKKPTPQEVEKEEEEVFDEEEETEIENEDNNFDESSAKEIEVEEEVKRSDKNVRDRTFNPVQIRPFNFQRRSKRQAVEYGSRNKQLSDTGSYRYRRPKVKQAQVQERIDYYDEEYIPPSEPPKTSRTGRIYTPRTRSQTQTTNPPVQPRIRPTTASSQSSARAPFTLREKEQSPNPRTTNFRRGQNTSTRRKTSSFKGTEAPTSRKSTRRGQTQNQALNDLTRSNQRRGYSNGRRTSSSRTRSRFGEAEDPFTYQPSTFDGTITVTHKIPSEVTIPIVSGKVTEYRNVITAKPSIEVLGPHEYTVTSTNGGTVLFLNREVTETLNNGVTEVTKFIVHETPTTSIVFTPTTIRGRKTSFSHIIPSTVYDVEKIITTVQPQISPNAPLANILLSQLLLGNLNVPVPPNQPLGIPQPLRLPQQPTAVTPTTEYKTRTTTYVTSVTDQISTVLPITFRGKEILTTIVDNTVNVITATEYITDTLVVTPTLNANQQINSLLLPALLQAQLLNPNQQGTPPQLPIPGFTQLPFTPPLGLDQLKFDALQQQEIKIEDLTDDKAKLSRDNDIRLERESDGGHLDGDVEGIGISHKPKSRKKSDNKKLEPEPSKEIVTLYVSGRRPGEFSTILSTVTVGETSVAVRKREAALDDIDRLAVDATEVKQVQVLASKRLTLDDDKSEPSYLDLYVTPGTPELVLPVASTEFNSETQSLESVLGDVSKHVTDRGKPTSSTKARVKPTRNDYQKNPKKSGVKTKATKEVF